MRIWLLISVALLAACSSSGTTYRQPQDYYYHTVSREGETLSAISRWYTGSSTNWEFLLKHNPGLDPQRLRLGDRVGIPRGWMITSRPMPYYRSAPARPAPLPEAVPPPAPQLEAPPPADDWTVTQAPPQPQIEPQIQAGGPEPAADSEAAERRRRIRDRLLDDMLDGR